jgi:hypothetical protein
MEVSICNRIVAAPEPSLSRGIAAPSYQFNVPLI